MYSVRPEERERYIEEFGVESYIDGNGAVRWKSNDNVPPAEIVNVWVEAGLLIEADRERADIERARDTERHLAAYRKAQAERTPEQIAEQRMEARAAMGPGVAMVNIITGERYTT
jgi:hypothetical protein